MFICSGTDGCYQPFTGSDGSIYCPLMELQTKHNGLPAALRADLHLHSRVSDGHFTPAELVHRTVERGLQLISLTDHDTVSGLPEARKIAREAGCFFVNGVELEASLQDDDGSFFGIHILGYGIDPENEELLEALSRIRENRVDRARKIHQRLQTIDINFPFGSIRKQATGETISRVHIAQVLKSQGHVSSMEEAFVRFLGAGKPAYVPRTGPDPEELIKLIQQAGGKAVWAHPYHTHKDEYVEQLVEAGIDGIECIHSDFSKSVTRRYKEMAEQHDLFVTGGSDYHGTLEEDFDLGDIWIEVDRLPFSVAVDPR